MSAEEKKNNRIGIITSLAVHGALFVIFFFMMAWRAPDPPLPEFGIELNFGLDTQGTGDVQPETPVGEEDGKEEVETQSTPEETQPEEVKPEVKDVVKESSSEKTVTEQATSKEEGPVAIKEEKKEVKKEAKKEEKVESKPEEKLKAEFKKEEKKEVAATDASKKGTPGNQGDDKDAKGDKGSPEGTLDSKALYGTPGGGGGGDGLNISGMTGWAWAEKPRIPEIPDTENGRIVFNIECDEDGEIVGVTTEERTLSAKAEQLLKDEIRRNSLVRTSGGKAPSRSKGKIVFVLKTQ
jgi:protein TonB